MNFNKHLNLEGKHAFLGASKWHWINYSEDKIVESYDKFIAVQKGTKLHEMARMHIEEGMVMPRNSKTFNMYVNDAIGFKMTPEQVLRYSDICFGTADAISFKNGLLRIHDLKTGSVPAHMEQLFIYDALFCLEYDVKPNEIEIENRIYQNDDKTIATPDPDTIFHIMDKIITFDEKIRDHIMGG